STMSKSKQEEALQFLDDLDSFAPAPKSSAQFESTVPSQPAEGEADVLAFIDEITQKSAELTAPVKPRSPAPTISRSSTPTVRKSTERVRLSGISPATSTSDPRTPSSTVVEVPASASGWGWGSVWSSASAVLQQARTAVDEQVKHLPKNLPNEQARKWGEGVLEYAKNNSLDINKLGEDFRRVGLTTLTDILNAVAPPISEHEVIQVWLSHDMRGYDGIKSLVYRSLERVLEQVEGGDLVVNSGKESVPKNEDKLECRDFAIVEGYDAAARLSRANLEEFMKANTNETKPRPPTSVEVPTIYSNVYLRVQAFTTTPLDSDDEVHRSEEQLHFLLFLSDPAHSITVTTVTQAVPCYWTKDNVWDKYEWVEDLVEETLRVGVEILGQEYVVKRMGWASDEE
ncbi:hypothetical protein FISHEDRAFT_24066, partial [Fistulina hepatica ATCC 64428]